MSIGATSLIVQDRCRETANTTFMDYFYQLNHKINPRETFVRHKQHVCSRWMEITSYKIMLQLSAVTFHLLLPEPLKLVAKRIPPPQRCPQGHFCHCEQFKRNDSCCRGSGCWGPPPAPTSLRSPSEISKTIVFFFVIPDWKWSWELKWLQGIAAFFPPRRERLR